MRIEIGTIQSFPDTLMYIGKAPEECIFFDIETTGFSVKMTQIYMIGCVYRAKDHWECLQWFAEGKEDESEVLKAFLTFCEPYKTLIHFNGEGFDLPYIRQKAEHYNLSYSLDSLTGIDLFKAVSSVKKFLKLENYKQKTVEKFLGINRVDQFTGGELIDVYADYRRTKDEESYRLLLLHNRDDLEGMTGLLPILSYLQLMQGDFEFDSHEIGTDEMIFSCLLEKALPQRISMNYEGFYMTAYGKSLKIRVPVLTGELRFFFPNYKDYYYLPSEDMAVHKSVASYVDKDYRVQAKAATCYIRKSGTFLPQFTERGDYSFRNNYNDKISYFELSDTFLNDSGRIHQYLLDIIKAL